MAAITGIGVGGPKKSYGTFAPKTTFVPELPLRIVEYIPGPVPYDLPGHTRYLQDELFKVSDVLQILTRGWIQEVNAEPIRPRTGDIALADGTNWNPGSGQGVYCYYNNTWNKLG